MTEYFYFFSGKTETSDGKFAEFSGIWNTNEKQGTKAYAEIVKMKKEEHGCSVIFLAFNRI